jgi:hypothetical protein
VVKAFGAPAERVAEGVDQTVANAGDRRELCSLEA